MYVELLHITPGLQQLRDASPISWVENPQPDGYGQTVIGFYGGWTVFLWSLGFNDRLVLGESDGTPYYGWCYRKGGAAHLAAMAWDPEAHGEPSGYIKATVAVHCKNDRRQAGERWPDWRVPLV